MIRQKIPQSYICKCQSLKVPPCHFCGSTEFGSCMEGSLLWKDVRRMYRDSRWDSDRQPRGKGFGHWEDPSFPNLWRMHHLVSHLSITVSRDKEGHPQAGGCGSAVSPQLLSTLPGRNRVSQEWGILSATLCSNRRLGTSSGFDRVWSGLCQAGRVI